MSFIQSLIKAIIPTNIFGNSDDVRSLKLESQKVTPFSGSYEEWPRWCTTTKCTLIGSGFERCLSDEIYATNHPIKNRILYSQLVVATASGTAHHLVQPYEDMMSGFSAWQALLLWYNRDVIKQETAETLRTKLENLKLSRGNTASNYINQFKMQTWELAKIPREGMTNSHSVHLFFFGTLRTKITTTLSVFCRQKISWHWLNALMQFASENKTSKQNRSRIVYLSTEPNKYATDTILMMMMMKFPPNHRGKSDAYKANWRLPNVVLSVILTFKTYLIWTRISSRSTIM